MNSEKSLFFSFYLKIAVANHFSLPKEMDFTKVDEIALPYLILFFLVHIKILFSADLALQIRIFLLFKMSEINCPFEDHIKHK